MMREWQTIVSRDGQEIEGTQPKVIGFQPSMFPTRISTIYPGNPIGKDLTFCCTAFEGGTYHCKGDTILKNVCATEWICQSLARHLGIAVPEFRVMEDSNGDTFFGSRQAMSTADLFEVRDFLTRPHTDEIGRPTVWLRSHLAMIYVLDIFVANPDRSLSNFVLERDGSTRRLCVIDFADARLAEIAIDRFEVAGSSTLCDGRFLQGVHGGFDHASAFEMIERIRAVPSDFLVRTLGGMPREWLSEAEKQNLLDSWSSGKRLLRLSALRAGIENGTLL
jgi:hypothetical protein